MCDNDKLTEQQKKLVEKNYYLMYTYAYKKNIPFDEYSDVLAIGLCKAAKAFDYKKANFSTLAYCCMENELYTYWRESQKESAIPENLVLSYDAPDAREDPDNKSDFLESFADYQSYDDMMYATMLSDIEKILTANEKRIMYFLLEGLTQSEIADKLGCKQQSVGYHINNIRNKVVDYLYN